MNHNHTFIIAEAGSNHNRNFGQALALIDAANNQGGHDNTTVVTALLGGALRIGPSTQDTLDIQPRLSLWGRVWRFVFRRK